MSDNYSNKTDVQMIMEILHVLLEGQNRYFYHGDDKVYNELLEELKKRIDIKRDDKSKPRSTGW